MAKFIFMTLGFVYGIIDMPTISIIGIAIGVVSNIIFWIVQDTKIKTEAKINQKNFEEFKASYDDELGKTHDAVSELKTNFQLSKQDREQLHKEILKIESSKANKEVVEGFKSELESLKKDMDKRFDKIEALIQQKK